MTDRLASAADVVLGATIVALTLATAWIHSTLGGQLFTLSAIGYFVGAIAFVVPISIAARYRWLIRIGLAAYAATSIAAWAVQPTWYSTAYLAKTIEIALITLLAIDFVRHDGSPIQRIRNEPRSILARAHGPASGQV